MIITQAFEKQGITFSAAHPCLTDGTSAEPLHHGVPLFWCIPYHFGQRKSPGLYLELVQQGGALCNTSIFVNLIFEPLDFFLLQLFWLFYFNQHK